MAMKAITLYLPVVDPGVDGCKVKGWRYVVSNEVLALVCRPRGASCKTNSCLSFTLCFGYFLPLCSIMTNQIARCLSGIGSIHAFYAVLFGSDTVAGGLSEVLSKPGLVDNRRVVVE